MTDERDSSPQHGIRAAHEQFHRAAYRRLGSRYARVFVGSDAVGLLHLVLLVTTATWPLYIDMSLASAIRLVVAVQLLFAGVSVSAWRVAVRLVRPVEDWIAVPDDRSRAAAAWRAAVEFPFAFFRAPSILIAALFASAAATIYAGMELDLPWYEALVLLAGLGIALAGSVLALSALWRAVALPHLVGDVRAVCGLWPAL